MLPFVDIRNMFARALEGLSGLKFYGASVRLLSAYINEDDGVGSKLVCSKLKMGDKVGDEKNI